MQQLSHNLAQKTAKPDLSQPVGAWPAVRAVVFDAYGTLLDVYSVQTLAEQLFPGKGQSLAQLWRDKQIDYTRLRSMSGRYKPFWGVTQDALAYAVQALGLGATPVQQQALLQQYARLIPHAHASKVLQQLQATGLATSVLTNANLAMVQPCLNAAELAANLDVVLTVDTIQKYKTDPATYALATAHFDCAADQLLFVTSNAWDAAGASWAGLRVLWINRSNTPFEVLDIQPAHIGSSLLDVLQVLGLPTQT